jgi:hypothetical protein
MEYLRMGLIPWSHYNYDLGQSELSLSTRLSDLSPEERRTATRKFRKLLRKRLMKGTKVNKDSYWSKQYAVYHSIGDGVRKKLAAKDNDT